MAVRLRLTRKGRKNRPFYRIGAYDNRTRRDGAAIEFLGHYDPLAGGDKGKVELNEDRVRYWLSVGATPSETVASILKRSNIELPRKAAKKKG